MSHMAARVAQATMLVELERCGAVEERLALYLMRSASANPKAAKLSQTDLGRLAGMSARP